MPENGLAVALLTGSLAIFLGLSSVLDDLVQGIRNYNVIGTPQRVTRPREPEPVSRFDRLCFVVAGAAVILFALLAAAFAK
ncbi:MAG: hypothetical protein QOJ99_164 [Bryobacterales bacterium]|jgi:hypothetical protein|nr:hypothetical protein [Bryobacterales bacterium]